MGVVTDGGGVCEVGVGVSGEIVEGCGVEIVFIVAESRDMECEWTHLELSVVVVVSAREGGW